MRSLRLILKGGHGNQLFQFFAGLELSRSLNRELVIDTSWYQRAGNKNGLLSPRQFSLDQYEVLSKFQVDSALMWKNSIQVERVIKRLPHAISQFLGFYPELELNQNIKSVSQEIVTFGHWINRPILPSKIEIKTLLANQRVTNSIEMKNLKQEQNSFPVISIHFRLGDYENFKSIYEVTGLKYFSNALNQIGKSIDLKKVKIWLFSDEPKKAHHLIASLIKVDRVLDEKTGLNEAETISLMSGSRAIICSNSTFSWWAGYLSEDNTQVYFPKQYLRGLLVKSTGLYVDEWNYL